jgi:hypothetical protein
MFRFLNCLKILVGDFDAFIVSRFVENARDRKPLLDLCRANQMNDDPISLS